MTRSTRWSRRQLGCVWLLGLLVGFRNTGTVTAQNVPPRKYAVQVSAQVQESPPQILLSWPNEGDATAYQVSKRTLDSGWQQVSNLSGGETTFSDGSVAIGTKYEYQIVKRTYEPYTAYGYISAGIRIPAVDYRGKVLVLAENSAAGALGGELAQFERDLAGDGWLVINRTAAASDSPQSVKELIKGVYYSDPQNVKALILVGHLPVPYSGDFFPDGHANHRGAWPADSYYADMDGNWTDSSVNSTTAERQSNWNVPGDGKFDQSNIPSRVELMVGRIDLSNLTCFANKANARSELDLMRQYFQKNHAFRTGDLQVERRGLICDNFADKGADPISNSAWRNFSGFFGANNVTEVGWDGYVPAATQNSYLWSYGSGGGSYYYATGVATSDDFALNNLQVVFTMFMGSYFGDWNNESNFLRAALGSGTVLTASYSGFPHTLYFPMALGEPIGYAIALTQNNSTNTLYPPWNTGSGQVHIALMGDPTLRMHAVRPPSSLNADSNSGTVRLRWNGSSDNVLGYYIYRSSSSETPYGRITAQPVSGTSYNDTPPAGSYTYMVRAVKLEQTPSGTYFNQSEGIFANATSSGSPVGSTPPPAPSLTASATAFNRVDLRWTDPGTETGFTLERKSANGDWSALASPSANVLTFSDTTAAPLTAYVYRVRAFNSAGASPYSSEVTVQTPSAPQSQASVRFVEVDQTTQGNWPTRFGADGYALANKPALAQLSGLSGPVWSWGGTTDNRAPVNSPTASDRTAAAWYGESLTLGLSFVEAKQVAFYFVDWDRAGRTENITVSDAATGAILDNEVITSFEGGKYLVYELKGNVQISISKQAGPNAVLFGVFAGPLESTPISDRPLALAWTTTTSGAALRVSGDAGQKFKVYTSTDLRSWTEAGTYTLSAGTLEVPWAPSERRLFLRTLNVR